MTLTNTVLGVVGGVKIWILVRCRELNELDFRPKPCHLVRQEELCKRSKPK